MSINGVHTHCLIDTDATSSAIHIDLITSFSNYQQFVSRSLPKKCVTVNSEPLTSLYAVKLPLTFKGGNPIFQKFEVIANLIHPIVLGTDFLKSKGVKLDFKSNRMSFDKVNVPIGYQGWSPTKPIQLVSLDNVELESRSVSLIRIDTAQMPTLKEVKSVLVGPLKELFGQETDIMASYSVVDPFAKEIYLEILNPSVKTIHLPTGHPVALLMDINPEIVKTDMKRDLNSMPKELIDPDEATFYDGFCSLFERNSKNEPVQSNPTPKKFSEGIPAGVKEPQAGGAPSNWIEHKNPTALLTKAGIVPFKYESLGGVQDKENETENDRQTDSPRAPCEPDPEYVPTTEGTVLEGKDLEDLETLLEKYKSVFAKHS